MHVQLLCFHCPVRYVHVQLPLFLSLLCSVNAYAAAAFLLPFSLCTSEYSIHSNGLVVVFDGVFVMCITDVTSEGAGVCSGVGG